MRRRGQALGWRVRIVARAELYIGVGEDMVYEDATGGTHVREMVNGQNAAEACLAALVQEGQHLRPTRSNELIDDHVSESGRAVRDQERDDGTHIYHQQAAVEMRPRVTFRHGSGSPKRTDRGGRCPVRPWPLSPSAPGAGCALRNSNAQLAPPWPYGHGLSEDIGACGHDRVKLGGKLTVEAQYPFSRGARIKMSRPEPADPGALTPPDPALIAQLNQMAADCYARHGAGFSSVDAFVGWLPRTDFALLPADEDLRFLHWLGRFGAFMQMIERGEGPDVSVPFPVVPEKELSRWTKRFEVHPFMSCLLAAQAVYQVKTEAQLRRAAAPGGAAWRLGEAVRRLGGAPAQLVTTELAVVPHLESAAVLPIGRDLPGVTRPRLTSGARRQLLEYRDQLDRLPHWKMPMPMLDVARLVCSHLLQDASTIMTEWEHRPTSITALVASMSLIEQHEWRDARTTLGHTARPRRQQSAVPLFATVNKVLANGSQLTASALLVEVMQREGVNAKAVDRAIGDLPEAHYPSACVRAAWLIRKARFVEAVEAADYAQQLTPHHQEATSLRHVAEIARGLRPQKAGFTGQLADRIAELGKWVALVTNLSTLSGRISHHG